MLGQISDREWLDSDAALSQHHITQGISVVDFRITQEPDDSQHYNGLPVMQETEDNENMNCVGPIETGHQEEHGEEHIINTSLPYLKNMTPRLTRLFNNAGAVNMKIANSIMVRKRLAVRVHIRWVISYICHNSPTAIDDDCRKNTSVKKHLIHPILNDFSLLGIYISFQLMVIRKKRADSVI
ncbi:hypothetical protein WA026_004483 [Henosepilachna vigintioctopunctata]|uniref:Uncharacterized protein n=1 Tax=Henosepilachna vigintioctopunctata TaxID=420089 RepID=A0AAW1VA64_9CUCU